MGQRYTFLLVNDTSTFLTRNYISRDPEFTSRFKNDTYTIGVRGGDNPQTSDYPGVKYLAEQLSDLARQGTTFKKCVFTTHGGPGHINFGTDELTRYEWYSKFYNLRLYQLFPYPDSRAYFPGCDVAAGPRGWSFLEAAARSLFRGAGGWAFGWTSDGWKLPFINHPQHFSGDVRAVYVSPGGTDLRFYENWKLITDGQGDPARPS